MSEYLGKPVATFLASCAYKVWANERKAEEALNPEQLDDYDISEHGKTLTSDSDKKIESIFGQAKSFNQSLSDFSSRCDVTR